MIAIVDYGMGNLRSVEKALKAINIDSVITDDEKVIKESSALILPGVGAFSAAMKRLREKNLDEVLKREKQSGKLILGICLGMQLLFNSSDEVEYTEGLGFIDGHIKKFEVDLKIPHMGWNSIKFNNYTPFLNGIKDGSYVYFVHSYYAQTDSKFVNAYTHYGVSVPAIVSHENVVGFQFHPEKSGEVGLKMLENIKEWLK